MKKIFFLIFLIGFFFLKSVYSQEPNNKFGIHLAQPHLQDLPKVKELVNSNGGDWGYITLVIQENDRDKNKWQNIFDHLRRLHLIPIIRLATYPQGSVWARPKKETIDGWVDFLDSLNWVIKNRYIVLFNEPNHGSEWGGEADPQNYSDIALAFSKALKQKNKDFFIMLAGMDASAPHWPPQYFDEKIFLEIVFDKNKDLINYLDGWSSHSYPNPGFSGSPYDLGRGTIRTYEWELNLLRSFGIDKNLPVFITETGWKHNQYNNYQKQLSPEIVADYFKIAFENIWLNDQRVKAVTPFVFDYQAEPFLEFSWKKISENDFYPQYYLVSSLPKIKGEPEQIEKGEIKFNLSEELVEQSDYHFKITLKNQGQGYWTDSDYQLLLFSDLKEKTNIEFLSGHIGDIMPSEEKEANIYLKTKNQGKEKIKFILKKNNKKILESKEWDINILPLPSLKFKVHYWPWGTPKADDFEIQIFDWEEQLVFKKKGIRVENGVGFIDNIKNITLSDLYRVVILKPGFLPRQQYFVFRSWGNEIKFKKLLPFDKNKDGKFNFFQDVLGLF
ncbi:MAG: hypothetical protein NZM02_02075 [Patescibacteria group bacterium]|nr:hypothetical protein [Patescibacteria group bacterium]